MEQAKIVIVGAGPAGIATAVEAKEASIEPVIILEKKGHLCDTVVSLYHEGKRVDPVFRKVKVEPIGRLSFDTETREAFLDRMRRVAEEYALDVRFWKEVRKVVPADGAFEITTGDGLTVRSPIVVVAIGVFGKPVRPSYPIPAEVKDKVYFSLPKTPLAKRRVLVVGGGDTAAETACFLSCENDVTLSYRRPEFFRLNEMNLCSINECARKGKVNLMMGTDIDRLEPSGDGVNVVFKDGRSLTFDAVFYCLGGMTPRVFLEGTGVEYEGDRPKVDDAGETNIPGLFLAGDLLVEKGTIMAAFNSGKKVVDGILARYGSLVKG